MRDLAIMLKPASSLCNLRCKYCFYEAVAESRCVKSYGFMTRETACTLLENIFCDLAPGDRVSFAFQGGEPTLAGLDFFRDFVRQARQHNRGCELSYQLQTNGILLDDAWCAFLKENDFLVGLSLDGMARIHDANRVDSLGHGTFDRVMAAKELLDAWKVEYNVLMTLTNTLASEPEAVWDFLLEQRIGFVQFTPCFGDSEEALTPEMFAHFYTGLFPLWQSAWEKGKYISVKLIDDLVTLLATGVITACGLTGKCAPQIIVEANGDVYPCDFYATDTCRIGNLCDESIKSLYESPMQAQFRCLPRHMPLCVQCRFKAICGGNCRRLCKHICYDEKAEACGYEKLLSELIGPLRQLAWQQRF